MITGLLLTLSLLLTSQPTPPLYPGRMLCTHYVTVHDHGTYADTTEYVWCSVVRDDARKA